MKNKYLQFGAIAGAIAVALGAFAAHGLKKVFEEPLMNTFETAVRYQFYHVFALLVVGLLYIKYPVRALRWAGDLFISGIIIFCGSLYLLCYAKFKSAGMEWLGAVTPFGGAAFIGGWIALLIAVCKRPAS